MINPDYHLIPSHLINEIKEDAWYLIDEFFSHASLEGWRHWLHNWFTAALDEASILKEMPADFLYATDRLQLLLYGCRLLITQQQPEQDNILKETPASLKTRDVMMKHLSLAETIQPIAVINAFFQYQHLEVWLLTLHLWKQAALGDTSVIRSEESCKLMPVMDHLYRLAEAAFIVWQTRIAVI